MKSVYCYNSVRIQCMKQKPNALAIVEFILVLFLFSHFDAFLHMTAMGLRLVKCMPIILRMVVIFIELYVCFLLKT